MKVEWTANALNDLTAIYQYIAKDSPRYAVAMVDRLTARTRQLAQYPLSGQQVPEYRRSDVRELIEGIYRLIYSVKGDRVQIVAVIHGASLLPATVPAREE